MPHDEAASVPLLLKPNGSRFADCLCGVSLLLLWACGFKGSGGFVTFLDLCDDWNVEIFVFKIIAIGGVSFDRAVEFLF